MKGLARQVRPSRLASTRSFSKPRLNLVLTRGFLSFLLLSATASIHTVNHHRVSPEFIAVMQLRIDGIHNESAGIGPVVLKEVRVTSAPYSCINKDRFLCAHFSPHQLLVCVLHINRSGFNHTQYRDLNCCWSGTWSAGQEEFRGTSTEKDRTRA